MLTAQGVCGGHVHLGPWCGWETLVSCVSCIRVWPSLGFEEKKSTGWLSVWSYSTSMCVIRSLSKETKRILCPCRSAEGGGYSSASRTGDLTGGAGAAFIGGSGRNRDSCSHLLEGSLADASVSCVGPVTMLPRGLGWTSVCFPEGEDPPY